MENMSGLQETLKNSIARRYTENAARIYELAGPLTEAQFWVKPFTFGNSFGHLVLHLTGNLNYYIGAQIANTGYVRDREREFTERSRLSKAEVLQRLADVIAIVLATVDKQSPEDWSAEYSAVRTDCSNRLDIFVQCATHMRHHIGQMTYLASELERQAGDKP
jgi:uncharacterized damage-inducible protein DinB